MENEDGEQESDVAELRLKAETLKQELKECRAELNKLQKQLSQSERLQRSTESYNEDLRKQVEQLSAEIHEWKKKSKDRVDIETQTEEYVWTETDYYNYYYGDYYQNPEAADTQESQTAAGMEEAVGCQAADVSTTEEEAVVAAAAAATTAAATTAAADVSAQPDTDSAVPVVAEASDAGSIADMLRSTAEEAMTQTGFVFDETTGMYYDHSTGFYYDSASQLYYDASTGIYYYYDAESGRYQFHSKIEVPAAQTGAEQDKCTSEKKGRWFKKVVKKTSQQADKEVIYEEGKKEEKDADHVERHRSEKTSDSRRSKRRSRSPDLAPRAKDSKRRSKRDRSSSRRKKQKNGSRHDEKRRSKKKKKKKKSQSARSDESTGNSEPEEGELTESERDESTPSPSPSPPPSNESPETEMETQCQADIWPPCVRVTVVRSPVLQVGTLFIITADCAATIGREKEMDHAIRIPEMGVSKFHAEVYFDQEQQSYVLVDQGSQNGTVINGNRILQPKTKCDPHALMHGDEVKMGDTVLSFHIHSGTDTCDGCEPGQVMAHLSKHVREEPSGPPLSKEDKEALRQKELKQMKAKYGLQSKEETKALRNPKYKDRAECRRQTVGSEGTFQPDDAPASVHVEINEVNKGRKMLEKMGWKKGEGLGKEGTGMKHPIQLKIRKSQSGLGAGAAVSLDDASSLIRTKSQKNWEKARERFADSCQPDPQKAASPKAWVRAAELDAATP